MVKTVFIGQSFLSRIDSSGWTDYYTFYGADALTANIWQVNFSKERIGKFNDYYSISTPFRLNLEEGSLLRIPSFFLFTQKDGTVNSDRDKSKNFYSDECSIASIRIVEIGQDFLTVEYILA